MALARGTAVVRGALSIIGSAYADHLAANGYDLVLIDGHRARLNAFAQELTTRTRRAIEVVVMAGGSLPEVTAVREKIGQDASIVLVVDIADEIGQVPLSTRQANELIGVIASDRVITSAAASKFLLKGVGVGIYRVGVLITAVGNAEDLPDLFQACDFE
ncbi:MAG TPA: hypothetical protein VN289_09300 [Paraburkholderia sp.]|jgi:NAD(P)-dependent dehydrogenase (short-subunit alcohol dehydrogenase family)|nr:hypothetical protein [Paraburkholderia sp.]